MSKPRYGWWPYVKSMIRNYPQRCREWEELKTISVTPDYSAVGHGSGISKPTEQVALKLFPETKQKEYDAVREALDETVSGPDGSYKVELIKAVYWRRDRTLYGAARCIGVSERTARRWHTRFIYLVAEKYGFDVDR